MVYPCALDAYYSDVATDAAMNLAQTARDLREDGDDGMAYVLESAAATVRHHMMNGDLREAAEFGEFAITFYPFL
jgi:hypothetical protein